MRSYIAGLTRKVSKSDPRAYCWNCGWQLTRTSGKTAPRVAEAAREHAREKGHATRFLVLTVTEYRPEATP